MSLALPVLGFVWRGKGYVFIPRRKGDQWDEGPAFSWPEDRKAIAARIKQSNADGWDVYWTPLLFEKPRRRTENVQPNVGILWADLDDVDPETIRDLRPTVAWRSSDDRYQAIWSLDGEHGVEEVQKVNRSLTYHLGADKSGWDVTQVLRVPGSVNHKYTPPQQGELLWMEHSRVYSMEAVKSRIGNKGGDSLTASIDDEDSSIEELLSPYSVPERAWEILNSAPEVGERSDRLWELEHLLLESGVPVRVVLQVVKKSDWNKYRGRRDEDYRILEEVLKADAAIRAKASRPSVPAVLVAQRWAVPYGEFMSTPTELPEWLVDGIWQKGTYGLIAGEPKTFKSVLSTDLALSVVSGKPFLGRFPVRHRAGVLMIQEENNPQTMKDRLLKIAHYKEILEPDGVGGYSLPPDLPLYMTNNFGFDITSQEHQALVESTLENRRDIEVVIFDPLYLMLGGVNENDASELRPILQWLTSLRVRYGVAIIVVHHFKKTEASRGGLRVRGTGNFHAWTESALYLELIQGGGAGEIEIEREFRSFPSTANLRVRIEIGEPGELVYRPHILTGSNTAGLADMIKKEELLSYLMSGPKEFRELQTALKISRPRLEKYIKEAVRDGTVKVRRGGGRGRPTLYEIAEGVSAGGGDEEAVQVQN